MNYRRKMVSTKNPSYEYSALPSQDKKIVVRKFPTKAICLAIILFTFGSTLIVVGSLLLTGHIISPEYNDRTWPVLLLGLLMFIPGAYHVRIAVYAYKKYPGFSYHDIPDFSD